MIIIKFKVYCHHTKNSLRRHHGSSGKYVYELKSEYEELCCPFFYHYTRPDHSKVGTGLDTSVHVMSCTYLTQLSSVNIL